MEDAAVFIGGEGDAAARGEAGVGREGKHRDDAEFPCGEPAARGGDAPACAEPTLACGEAAFGQPEGGFPKVDQERDEEEFGKDRHRGMRSDGFPGFSGEDAFDECADGKETEGDGLPEFGEEAGFGGDEESATDDEAGEAVFGDFVALFEGGVGFLGFEGEAGEESLVFGDDSGHFGFIADEDDVHDAAAAEEFGFVVDRFAAIAGAEADGPFEVFGGGVVEGRGVPADDFEGGHAALGHFGIGGFLAFLELLEDGFGVEFVLFVVFHVSAIVELEDGEPAHVIGGDVAEFLSVGEIAVGLHQLDGAWSTGEAVAGEDFDLRAGTEASLAAGFPFETVDEILKRFCGGLVGGRHFGFLGDERKGEAEYQRQATQQGTE